MALYWSAIALAVLANVAYHVIQKKTPEAANPALTLSATYFVAAVVCFAAFLVLPGRGSIGLEFARLNWTSAALGIAIIGLELGFLLAYRAGGNVNTAALVANIAVSVILIPVGLLLFGEKLKPVNIVGIVLCVAGLVCMASRE
jgi:drug/metabolite transporter (DMT)-like permease